MRVRKNFIHYSLHYCIGSIINVFIFHNRKVTLFINTIVWNQRSCRYKTTYFFYLISWFRIKVFFFFLKKKETSKFTTKAHSSLGERLIYITAISGMRLFPQNLIITSRSANENANYYFSFFTFTCTQVNE